MKVLSILQYSPPSPQIGGAERQTFDLHTTSIKDSYEVEVIADINNVKIRYQFLHGVKVWGFPYPHYSHQLFSKGTLKYIATLIRLIFTILISVKKFDIIQITPIRENVIIALLLHYITRKPWIGRIACSGSHGDINYLKKNWVTKILHSQIINSNASIVALDFETLNESIEFGFKKERVKIIPNAILINEYKSGITLDSKNSPNDLLERLNLYYIGRVSEQKNLKIILPSLSLLKISHSMIFNKIHLHVAGRGEMMQEFIKMISQYNLQSAITIHGWVNPVDFLSNARGCIINPSFSEGLPNSVLEGLYFGLIPILSHIPVHIEIAKACNSEHLLFKPNSPEMLVKAILYYDSMPLSQRQMLSQQAKIYSMKFSRIKRNSSYYTIYNTIISK